MKHTETRSGSALVVVLGMLAVIMLMAVAFSVYMRTERAGTTNLRHALVAKEMMQSAIARTMQSIDESFGNPKDNWPAPDWEEPYLTSHEPIPVDRRTYQSARSSNAIDRAASARILTREIMMHLSPSQLALADNAKIDWASISSGVSSEWGKDPIVGRYAFIAFDVSGLHDMNKAGGGLLKARGSDFATNAVNYQVADSLFFGAHDGPEFKPAYDTFVSERGKNPFMSMAHFWRSLGVRNGPESYDFKLNQPIDPDLFTTYSMSLESLAPGGSMKLPLVAPKSDAEKKALAKLAVTSFDRMFKEAGDDKQYRFKAAPIFSRADLATQALIDYLDADDVPSGGIVTLKADGSIDESRGSGDGYLNFPCTEPVPMVTQAMAWFDVESRKVEPSDLPKSDWYTEYKVGLTVVCEAQLLNDKVPKNLVGNNYNLKMSFEFTDFADLWDSGELWRNGSRANGWEVNVAQLQYFDQIQTAESGPKAVTPGTRNSASLYAKVEKPNLFTVKAYHIIDGSGNATPRKFTKLEQDGTKPTQLTEIRIKAQVLSGGKVVQQVPCPILEKNAREDYRIRVSPGLYHKTGERDVRTQGYEWGWAMCIDPRFAYNTESVVDFTGSAGFRFWVDNYLAREDLPSGGNPAMKDIAQALIDAEKSGAIEIPELGNYLIKNVYFSEPDVAAARNIADVWSNGMKIYPDAFHRPSKGGKTFIDKDAYASVIKSRIANLPMVSPGELGNLLVGPWETLSLFASFDPNDAVTFHRALDYFSLGESRYPRLSEVAAKTLPNLKERHLSGMQTGRINLNPQRLVKSSRDYERRGEQILDANGYPEYNIDPLVCVLSGAGINQDQAAPTQLPVDVAEEVAEAFYREAKIGERAGQDRGALMISRLSDFGHCNVASNANPVLDLLVANGPALKIECDAHREALIANSVNALTVRGQSFLVVIRAEAFSPRYGSDSPENGTTLSTTYAIVELWRDPEPARYPDGSLYPDNTTPFHPWAIRSIRWF